jgi:serralysin
MAAGAVGNARDLVLSPQHGVMVAGVGLIRARHLADFSARARVMRGARAVAYHHLLLPRHALIWAEGAVVESFYPGPMAMAALRPADRRAVAAVILGAAMAGADLVQAYGARCVPLLSRAQARLALAGAGGLLPAFGGINPPLDAR